MLRDIMGQTQPQDPGLDGKEVAFDSSEETKRRIAALIILLHESSYGVPMEGAVNINPRYIYIRTLKRLYVEVRAKLTDEEKKKCEDELIKLGLIQLKYRKDMYPADKKRRENYYLGWAEYVATAEEFEIYLMELLDKHGFLMKDKPKKIKPH